MKGKLAGIWFAAGMAWCITPMNALRTAAGGTSGQNGFADVTKFLDTLCTYVIFIAIPAGALGLIAAGGMLIAGNQDGSTWLARTAVGVGIVLLSKGIMS
jgi:hypothetical protein